jgi:hypothetical protein
MKTVSHQWCIEQNNGNEFFASHLVKFESKYKLLKKGKAALCLMRTEAEDGVVVKIFWAYSARGVLKPFIDEVGLKHEGLIIPERYAEELQAFANKDRTSSAKRKEANLPQNFIQSYSLNDRIIKPRDIKVDAVKADTIPIRIDKKTVMYIHADATRLEIDRVLNLYKKESKLLNKIRGL